MGDGNIIPHTHTQLNMFWIGIFLETEDCEWVTVYSGKYGT